MNEVTISRELAARCAEALINEHNQVTHYSCCVFSYERLVDSLTRLGCFNGPTIISAKRPEGWGFGQDGKFQRLDQEPGGWVLTPSNEFKLVGRHTIDDWKTFVEPALKSTRPAQS